MHIVIMHPVFFPEIKKRWTGSGPALSYSW